MRGTYVNITPGFHRIGKQTQLEDYNTCIVVYYEVDEEGREAKGRREYGQINHHGGFWQKLSFPITHQMDGRMDGQRGGTDHLRIYILLALLLNQRPT